MCFKFPIHRTTLIKPGYALGYASGYFCEYIKKKGEKSFVTLSHSRLFLINHVETPAKNEKSIL